MIIKNMRRFITYLFSPVSQKSSSTIEQSILQIEYSQIRSDIKSTMPGNPACNGYKVFSQGDEDGIIQEIVQKIEANSTLTNHVFLEIGAGNNGENNSSLLLMQGWRGIMLDADSQILEYFKGVSEDNLVILNERLDPDSKLDSIVTALSKLIAVSAENSRYRIGLCSLDIDGIDGAILSSTLEVVDPDILVLEYNASFPPPLLAKVNPKSNLSWKGDNYYGMSLQSWHELISGDYSLVACGITGVNSYWVKNSFASLFSEYPINQIYQPARYHLTKLKWGHEPNVSKWIKN